jgi:4-hydroxybenzoate polyprenyltransferase
VAHDFEERTPWPTTIRRTLRLHQWAKNILIFLPVLLAHNLQVSVLLTAVLAFFSFSFCASATYILNDLLDIEADRHHPRKQRRPFAAGDLSVRSGMIISAVLLAGAFLLATLALTQGFLFWLLIYLVTTLAYSLYFKRVVLVDVILLSGLYTVRMLAGSAATHIPISPWLGALSLFFFLSLAIVKRFSELQYARAHGQKLANGRGYLLADIEQLRSFGTASAFAAVLVFSFYIGLGGQDVLSLYHHPQLLWLITPFMALWIMRVWLLASRGELDEDPVIFAVTDRVSLLIGAAVAAIAALAAH